MNILVTGGAGYIASHVIKQLCKTTDHNIVVVDNLETGSYSTILKLLTFKTFVFYKMDVGNFELMRTVLEKHSIDAVIHFAANIVVSESVDNPLKYYQNNTSSTIELISACEKTDVKKFIFSSTAAVYGEPDLPPFVLEQGVSESFVGTPINAYGKSKLMSETVLREASEKSTHLKSVIFRYFNVAGADVNYIGDPARNKILSPRIGQRSKNATHLFKVIVECLLGKRDKILIYGNDFNTKDGTGVRDYIHVDDLAKAHILALDYLDSNESDTFNIGYGTGYSVLDVIKAAEELTGQKVNYEFVARREGDPACLIANSSKIQQKMQWAPEFNNIHLILESALQWEKTLAALN